MGGSRKILFTLYCVTLLAVILGQRYNLKRIGVCLQIACEATSAVAIRVVPLFHKLTNCIKFQSYADMKSVAYFSVAMMFFSWLQSLALEVHCLWKINDILRGVLAPHWQRLKRYECLYMGLPPKCIPKLL